MAFTLYKEIKYAMDGIPDANLTDFPKRFAIAGDSDIASECSGGGGVKVTSADGITDLPIEILASGTDLTSGDVEFWVKVSLLTAASVGDVIARLYYDGAETTIEDRAGVWSNNYALVMHMEQDPSGSAPQMYDSVSETNIGTSSGSMTSGDLVGGQVGSGLEFDGSDDYISTPLSHLNILTIEAIVAGANTGDFAPPIGTTALITYFTRNNANGAWDVWDGANAYHQLNFSSAFDNSPHSLAGTADGSTLRAYTDGVETENEAYSGVIGAFGNTITTLYLAFMSGSAHFGGLIDEVRVSSVARSADWLAYQYTDDFDNADTFTLGAEQGGGGGGGGFSASWVRDRSTVLGGGLI